MAPPVPLYHHHHALVNIPSELDEDDVSDASIGQVPGFLWPRFYFYFILPFAFSYFEFCLQPHPIHMPAIYPALQPPLCLTHR